MSAPPPPPPHVLGCAKASTEPLISPNAFDQLLAHNPERAASLLRLLDGDTFMHQVESHAALAGVPLMRVLVEWGELLEMTGEPRKAPPRPRKPRRPSITPNVPRRTPRTPHGPGDGRRKHWPRIRVRPVRSPVWA